MKKLKRNEERKGDIIKRILEDHKPLKELIEVLKGEATFSKKKAAFEKFAPLLTQHAKAEEESLYVHMKEDKELRSEAFEGDKEHAIANQLIEDIKKIKDQDKWVANVKVLAEVVEHHIKEEEKDIFKSIRAEMEMDERKEIGQEYQVLFEEHQA